jgi:3-oxoadipate enol-lactonase
MGGLVAQGLAIRHPELVRGVVLANTTAQYPAAARDAFAQRIAAVERGGMAAIVDAVVERFLRPEVQRARPALLAWVRQTLLRADAAAYAATCRAIVEVDWLGALPALRCPTLVIAGRHDVGATPAMAEQIAAAVPGARLVVLEGASHLSAVEDPAGFLGALETFVAAL